MKKIIKKALTGIMAMALTLTSAPTMSAVAATPVAITEETRDDVVANVSTEDENEELTIASDVSADRHDASVSSVSEEQQGPSRKVLFRRVRVGKKNPVNFSKL